MEINNVINKIQTINKIDSNDKIDIKLNSNEDDLNNEPKNNKNDLNNNCLEDDLSENSSDQSHEEEELDNNEDVVENDEDKIPNLYERILMDKNNLKYKELINKVKKNFKRNEMQNDNDLSDILKNIDINKKEIVKITYPKD